MYSLQGKVKHAQRQFVMAFVVDKERRLPFEIPNWQTGCIYHLKAFSRVT